MNNFLQCQVWNGESVCKSNDDLDLFERSCRVWVVRLKVEIALVFDFLLVFGSEVGEGRPKWDTGARLQNGTRVR
jgi:hypothetical protein